MSENRVKLLAGHVEIRLSFDDHIKQLCRKSSQKMYALPLATKLMDITKGRLLINSFITSQFSYCILI